MSAQPNFHRYVNADFIVDLLDEGSGVYMISLTDEKGYILFDVSSDVCNQKFVDFWLSQVEN